MADFNLSGSQNPEPINQNKTVKVRLISLIEVVFSNGTMLSVSDRLNMIQQTNAPKRSTY